MRFDLKVHRGARALVMLIDAPAMAFEDFAVCRCGAAEFSEALQYAQSHVALPTFLIGGDFVMTAASHVLDLRGIVAIEATDAAAARRLEVPLLLLGGSRAVADSAPDASRVVGAEDEDFVQRIAERFINAYA
jgi:hypothetical protein